MTKGTSEAFFDLIFSNSNDAMNALELVNKSNLQMERNVIEGFLSKFESRGWIKSLPSKDKDDLLILKTDLGKQVFSYKKS
jgi:hypothetical protein